jgi:hypothetical protein
VDTFAPDHLARKALETRRMKMQPIRQILEDAPATIPVPLELRHCRIEYILWPLDEPEEPTREPPRFNIADVDTIEIPPREARNERS